MFRAQRASNVFNARLQNLVDSERKIRDFVRSASTAIRSPLQAIAGFSQLLMQDGITDEERKAFAGSIATACESANKLLNDSQIEFES